MSNTEQLEQALRSGGVSVEAAAERIGVDKSTFYRKMKKGVGSFTVGEVMKMVETDVIEREDAVKIFLS